MGFSQISDSDWNAVLNQFADIHIMQTSGWAAFKQNYGWHALRFQSSGAAAQVLLRRLPLGYSIGYLPKGPAGSAWPALWKDIDTACQEHKAIFLQVEPDLTEPLAPEVSAEWFGSFQIEPHPIQPRRTILVDLTQTEEQLLAAMKQKTRYNIRLAQRHGVYVESSDDLAGFYSMMEKTGARDGFALHAYSYYQDVFETFEPAGQCVLLRAMFEDRPLAYLMLFMYGARSWYFYGASDNESRNLMPTYLLQWEAMRWAKEHGAATYDLWGIPDYDEETLEQDFTNRSDGLWGVYRFKRGFGGQVMRSAPAFIKVYRPHLYRLYQWYRKQRQTETDALA